MEDLFSVNQTQEDIEIQSRSVSTITKLKDYFSKDFFASGNYTCIDKYNSANKLREFFALHVVLTTKQLVALRNFWAFDAIDSAEKEKFAGEKEYSFSAKKKLGKFVAYYYKLVEEGEETKHEIFIYPPQCTASIDLEEKQFKKLGIGIIP